MKKVLIVLLVIVLLLGSCFAFGGHEQRMFQYVEAPIQEATFEELLAAPYATEGSWEFQDVFAVYHDEATWSEPEITPETHQELIANLRALLKDQTFTCATKKSALRSYDGYFEKLFNVKHWEMPFYIQLRAVSVPKHAPQTDSTQVTGVRIFALDNSCCYLTVSYQTEPEPDTTNYVFSSTDPELLESISTLICGFIEGN